MNPTPIPPDLERRITSLADEARSLEIVNQESYDLAAVRLRACVSLRIEIVDHHRDMKAKAFEAHRAVCAAEKKLLDPVAAAEAIYKQRIGAYETEQKRIEAEARRRADEEARAQAERDREAEIEAAEQAGADAEEVQALIAEPLPVVVREPPPQTFQRAAGISTAGVWKGEVFSMAALVRAIARGEASIGLIAADQSAINAQARATRGTLQIPGIRFYNEAAVRARR